MLYFVIFVCVILIVGLAISVHYLNKKSRQNALIIEEAISAFMGFIDAKDTTTNGHSKRVAKYTRLLARKMDFSEDEAQRMYYIGLMHDCGKIGIPDAILNKPAKLTDEEYEIIKTHTCVGEKILKDFHSIDGIRDGAIFHHEKYDGSGYPQGLKGKDIPLIGRMLCIIDSFDVMNSERCYSHKMTKEDILEQLRSNSGIQFDPDIVKIFMELLEKQPDEFWGESD